MTDIISIGLIALLMSFFLRWYGKRKIIKKISNMKEYFDENFDTSEKESNHLQLFDSKYVFDKAKYHDNSVQRIGLGEDQSFVHTGLFLAWLVNNNLLSESFVEESGSQIEELKTRKISPSALYIDCDGVFIGDMLNNVGFNFTMTYFDFAKGIYMTDYEKVFNVKGDQVYSIKDTWKNYDKIKPSIDAAYAKWNS